MAILRHVRCGKVGMGGYHARGGKQFNGNWERTRLTGGSVKRSQIYPRSHQVVYEAVKFVKPFESGRIHRFFHGHLVT